MDSNTQDDTTDDVQSVEIGKTTWEANILRNSRRIQILMELDSTGEGGLTIGELADRIAEREHGPQYGSKVHKAAYIAIYQCHAPKLDTWNVIDYQRDTVKEGRRFDEVVSALYQLQE